MRQNQDPLWSHYAPYVSMKTKLAETDAQLATLRDLGEAIRQQRQSLQQSLDHSAEPAAMAIAL